MHPHAELIRKLFRSVDAHNYRAAAACYADNARFRDIAFELDGRKQIASMWRMIADGDIRVTVKHVEADYGSGTALVVDDYTFRETGRPVRNAIESRFRFENGLIAEQRDECDARAWAAMALGGIPGFLAGRLRFLRRWKARSLLRTFESTHPEGSAGSDKEAR
jgi:ketosteroid isomerase-like protein